ncbi:ribokinase [Cognatilysobacter segetis]|uniref:ribokinase n=1 Tax=Cognatilysobacter segetis TaxID=2492394 RepID=UPI001062179B|nr:ribokinase [Lysobacter segetis]
MGGSVAVVGSFNVDHVWMLDRLPAAGETRSGRYMSGPGGKGFNQAMASARSGAATRFVCALGADAGGQYARALAVADDIDLRDAASDAPTGSAGIFVDAQGRNSIVVAPGANESVDESHVRDALAGESPAVVLAQLETPSAAAATAFAIAREAGALAILNPAPANAEVAASLLAQVDVLTPNESEFAALANAHLDTHLDGAAVAATADDALHALCRRLLPDGTVVVTLGAAGAFVSHADGARRGDADGHYRLPARAVDVRDTTGAGDAFNGALAASIAGRPQQPFAMHVRYAIAYAGLSTERPGAALSMPAHADVTGRFAAA